MTALYGLVAGLIGFAFGVPFAPLIVVVTTALQGVPYFGQLVSWMPLVLITAVFQPSVIVPVTVIFVILLLIVQNVVSPRVMANTVGLNPVLVLAAVFIGSQVAGVFGAMFGVPVLAVLVSLFETWLDEARPETGDIAATWHGGEGDDRRDRLEPIALSGGRFRATPGCAEGDPKRGVPDADRTRSRDEAASPGGGALQRAAGPLQPSAGRRP